MKGSIVKIWLTQTFFSMYFTISLTLPRRSRSYLLCLCFLFLYESFATAAKNFRPFSPSIKWNIFCRFDHPLSWILLEYLKIKKIFLFSRHAIQMLKTSGFIVSLCGLTCWNTITNRKIDENNSTLTSLLVKIIYRSFWFLYVFNIP